MKLVTPRDWWRVLKSLLFMRDNLRTVTSIERFRIMPLSYWYWYDIQPRSEQIKFRPFQFTCVVKHPIDCSIGFVFDFIHLFFQQKRNSAWIFYLFWFQQLCYHFITHFEAFVSRMSRTKTRLGDFAFRGRNDSVFRRLPYWCEHCGGKTLSEAGSRKMFAMTM